MTAGALLILVLTGLSLPITTVEQLRERRALSAALTALGTPDSTLGLSVLYQTAISVVLGLTTAGASGVSLGAVLLATSGQRVRIDWPGAATVIGSSAVVIVAVAVPGLPTLHRLTRTDRPHLH